MIRNNAKKLIHTAFFTSNIYLLNQLKRCMIIYNGILTKTDLFRDIALVGL